MNPKYKCFGCGKIFISGEILAICPVCRGKGVKIKEDSKISEEKWYKVISRAERFVERTK
ncbi:hypothetical protein ES705_23865 [subsurface metagenome]